jgi:hypothetical protein
MINSKSKTKCDFCKYRSNTSCMVTPNSAYCKEANDEYYQYLHNSRTAQPPQKSLRPWDKR